MRPWKTRRSATRLHDVSERLEVAYDRETMVLALTIDDREAILRALDAQPDGLAALRGVLLREHKWRLREGLVQFGSVAAMRVAGVHLGAPVARLLSETLESEGYPQTGAKIADAIARRITVEAPLTLEDYEAIATALSRNCPPPLYRLRTELLKDLQRLRRNTSG